MSVTTAAPFALLGLAIALLWAPRWSLSPRAEVWWTAPFALAIAAAIAAGLVDWRGLAALALMTGSAFGSRVAPWPVVQALGHVTTLALTAALFTHSAPGFDNPRVIDGVRLAAESLPYTKYLNFDKGAAGLLLLGVYAPRVIGRASRVATSELWRRFAVTAAVVIAATVAAGFAAWDPKLPAWWPLWLASMVFLTALPEEALFRGVVQERLHGWSGTSAAARWRATVAAGAVFGLAHAGGGWGYATLATLAGIGYGWIYAGGTIAASVLAHTGLNLIHLLLFSYPGLDRAGAGG